MVYTIKKGAHNDTRFKIPSIFTKQFTKTWTVALSPNCFYDWREDKDQEDINKLVGVTEFWSKNNVNSVMIGWNPCLLPEAEILEKYPHCRNLSDTPILNTRYFNIYYYINDEKGNHTAELSTVIADWRLNDIEIRMQRQEQNKGSYLMSIIVCPIQFVPQIEIRSVKWEPNQVYFSSIKGLLREIFIWFGGANNSPGEYGGVAPHDMLIKVN